MAGLKRSTRWIATGRLRRGEDPAQAQSRAAPRIHGGDDIPRKAGDRRRPRSPFADVKSAIDDPAPLQFFGSRSPQSSASSVAGSTASVFHFTR